jgi:hypothetical protein
MDAHARLRVTGPATEGYSVPAEVLVRAIQGVQQAVWLLAAATEARTVRQRFKPDQSLRQKFTLRIAVAEPGSYAIPMSLVDERPQVSLDAVGKNLLTLLGRVWNGIAESDLPSVRWLVTDEGYFVRLLQELRRILPKAGERWGVAFGADDQPEVELGVRHRPVVEQWLESPGEQRETSVIGDLLRIDFAVKRVWILYPPTSREIECSYREEVEDSIVDARRGLFQVTGQFVLDADGHPKQLTDVRSIDPVDLSPVQFAEVEADGIKLLLDPPIVLTPELDTDEQQFFTATVDGFGFTLGGRTRDALLLDFAEQMTFAWREYAEAKDDELTADALTLKAQLLQRLRRG